MAVARHHLEVLAQELFNGLGLGGLLHDYQILLHTHFSSLCNCGVQKYAKVLLTPYYIIVFLLFLRKRAPPLTLPLTGAGGRDIRHLGRPTQNQPRLLSFPTGAFVLFGR